MGIRSPLAKVSVLLSSSTLLRFSIQMASTGPSNTIQMRSPKEQQVWFQYSTKKQWYEDEESYLTAKQYYT